MSSTSNPLPIEWVDDLFELMSIYYGSRFIDMWDANDIDKVTRVWHAKLGCLTEAEFAAGVQALQTREHPPTLPQFLSLCRPALDSVRAYYEAVSGLQARSRGELGEWSHPAVYWAAVRMAHELRTQTFSQVRSAWELALKAEMSKGTWDAIDKPPVAQIAYMPAKHRESAAYRQASSQLKTIVSRQDDKSFDHKRWAKRIIERSKRPNNNVHPIQIQMAEAALRMPQE